MKRILSCAGLAVALAISVSLSAQSLAAQQPPDAPPPQRVSPDAHILNHGEIGVFGDLFRVMPSTGSDINFVGLGGRVGFNVHPNVALEAEMSYDFERNYTNVTSSGGTTTTVTSRERPITGLFGPKFQFGTSGPFRAFLEGKAGFIEFSSSTAAASGSSFSTGISDFGNGSTHFAAFPGGGIEAYLGPIGLRADAGDEVWINNGAHNNLRVTFGPAIRF